MFAILIGALYALFNLIAIPALADEVLHQDRPKQVSTLLVQEASVDRLSLEKFNPIYFLFGNPSSKIQLSFKYHLIDSIPIVFGYTQLMFWNLQKDSEPLKDINYNPELYYHVEFQSQVIESIDIAPYSHVSNGRDGEASRSLTRASLRFNLMFPSASRNIRFSATFYRTYGANDGNVDISDYVSPLSLAISLTEFLPWALDKGEISLRVFPGGELANRWDRGGQEFGLSFRLGRIGLRPAVYLQYYNGYAESLINYNRSESSVRGGIIL